MGTSSIRTTDSGSGRSSPPRKMTCACVPSTAGTWNKDRPSASRVHRAPRELTVAQVRERGSSGVTARITTCAVLPGSGTSACQEASRSQA